MSRRCKIHIRRIIQTIILCCCLLFGVGISAQNVSRSLGISLQAQTPHAFAAKVTQMGNAKGLTPVYKYSSKDDEHTWWQFENQKVGSQMRGYSVGAALNYMHSTRNYHFISVEGGLRLSRLVNYCLLYTSPSPRDLSTSRMPSSA